MKGRIDMFCASQASTAICMSMEQGSSSSTIYLGSSRAIDRHNPIIKDARRAPKTLTTAPCSSHQTPINPKPHKHHHKNRKSSSKPSDDASKKPAKQNDQKKKNCAEENDSFRRSFAKPSHLLTPPGSSRYLLGDTAFFKSFSDYDPVLALVPVESKKVQGVTTEETCYSLPASSSSSSGSSGSSNQVVVLRVSLHCKGCAGKVRKHISRMEGVTSFNIDFAAKKVTVIGDVTPLGVLASISKVKNAQLLTPAMSSQQPS